MCYNKPLGEAPGNILPEKCEEQIMKKVLILEDEVNIRSFVVINLKRAGYDAIEAAKIGRAHV